MILFKITEFNMLLFWGSWLQKIHALFPPQRKNPMVQKGAPKWSADLCNVGSIGWVCFCSAVAALGGAEMNRCSSGENRGVCKHCNSSRDGKWWFSRDMTPAQKSTEYLSTYADKKILSVLAYMELSSPLRWMVNSNGKSLWESLRTYC